MWRGPTGQVNYEQVRAGQPANMGRVDVAGIANASGNLAKMGGGGLMGTLASGAGAAVGEAARQGSEDRTARIRLWTQEHEAALDMKRQAAMEVMKQQAAESASERDMADWEKKQNYGQAQWERRASIKNQYATQQERYKGVEKAEVGKFNSVYQRKPDAVNAVITAAEKYGIDPTIGLSIWGQEGGYSTNTKLAGQKLSRGRGRAIGPFQIVKHYHPEFSEDMTFEEQADLAMKILAKQGVDGYYGKGNAPPGQPTTDDYTASVYKRANAIASVLSKANSGNLTGGFGVAKEKKMTKEEKLQAEIDAAAGGASTGTDTAQSVSDNTATEGPSTLEKIGLGFNKAASAASDLIGAPRKTGAQLNENAKLKNSGINGIIEAAKSRATAKTSGVTINAPDGTKLTFEQYVAEARKKYPNAPVQKFIDSVANMWSRAVAESYGATSGGF